MRRLQILIALPLILLVGCNYLSVPAPAEYDHASLRAYFGDSPAQLEAEWGKPDSVVRAKSPASPESPAGESTGEGMTREDGPGGGHRYVYAVRDGDLIFHFDGDDRVFAITYLGDSVAPPAAKDD